MTDPILMDKVTREPAACSRKAAAGPNFQRVTESSRSRRANGNHEAVSIGEGELTFELVAVANPAAIMRGF